jgi:alpha-L-fucosidase
MRENSESIYDCGAAGLPKPEWGRLTRKGNLLFAHVFERPMGPLVMPGLRGKIRKARLLRDGAEVRVQQPWNAADCREDAFIFLPDNAFPDPIDTVIMLEMKS